MPHYKATNRDTQEIVEYDEDVPRPAHLQAPWFCERMEEISSPPEVVPVDVPVYGGRRILTKLEFLRLMTQQERMQIRGFSKGNSQTAPVIEDFMFLLEIAQEINLNDQELIAGLQQLEAGGLLGAGRAAIILKG